MVGLEGSRGGMGWRLVVSEFLRNFYMFSGR